MKDPRIIVIVMIIILVSEMQHIQENTLSSSAPHQKTFVQYTNILKQKRDWTFKFCIITFKPLNVDTTDFQY